MEKSKGSYYNTSIMTNLYEAIDKVRFKGDIAYYILTEKGDKPASMVNKNGRKREVKIFKQLVNGSKSLKFGISNNNRVFLSKDEEKINTLKRSYGKGSINHYSVGKAVGIPEKHIVARSNGRAVSDSVIHYNILKWAEEDVRDITSIIHIPPNYSIKLTKENLKEYLDKKRETINIVKITIIEE